MADKLFSALGARAAVLTTDIMALLPTAGPPAEQATIAQLVTLLNTIYAPITGGAYVLKAGDTMTGLLTIAQATANTSVLASTGYSLTGANTQSLLDLAGTWNTSGVPTAIKLAITNTASGALSMLMDLRVGAASMFSVEKDGDVRSAGQIFSMSAIYGMDLWSGWNGTQGFVALSASANGVASLIPWSGTALRLQFGGTTSAFPSLKRSAAEIHFRLADDSALAAIQAATVTASMLRLTPALTVATLPAAGTQGRIAYVTDALAPAFLAIAVGGGGIVTTVFDNGTNWVSV